MRIQHRVKSCGIDGRIYGVIVLVGVLSVQAGCRRNELVPPPVPKVTVDNPVAQDVFPDIVYTGTVEAFEKVEIRARVTGFLEKIHFLPGADVEEGEPLYDIDPLPFQAQVDSAQAEVLRTQAKLQEAQAGLMQANSLAANALAQFKRAEPLAEQGAVSKEELDEKRTYADVTNANIAAAQAGIKVAETEIDAAKAALKVAELDLGYAKVTAPLEGRVGKTLVDRGNLVGGPQATHMTTVVRYDPIYASFTISSTDLLRFLEARRENGGGENGARGKEAPGKAPRVAIEMSLPNENDFPHKGELDYYDLEVDATTGTYLVRAKFDNKEDKIIPGLFVRIRLRANDPIPSLVVDERAVGSDQGGDFVLIVDSDNIVQRRTVQLGARLSGKRVVSSGLTESDRIIVNGLQRAREGAQVEAEPVNKQPEGK